MKILQKICFVLLLTTFSNVYGGSCFGGDVDKCRVLAEQGLAESQFKLGDMYLNGQGVIMNYKEAFKWTNLAAEQWHFRAQYNLGTMYFLGQSVIQDYVMAHMYFNIAAVSGAEDAKIIRGVLEERMIPSQVAEAQKLAREWMRTHQ